MQGSGVKASRFASTRTAVPAAKHPTGTASLTAPLLNTTFTGPVTCLAVNGNSATLNFVVTNPSNPAESLVFTYSVIDSPAGDLFIDGFNQRSPTDCSARSSFPEPIISGDVVVVDAHPPTTKEQCKHGGWKTYGVFKNQGDCVSFVVRQPLAG